MNYPLPIRGAHFVIDRVSYPALTVGLVTLGLLLALYAGTGSLYPTGMLIGFQDPLEAMGLFLLFSLLPAYLLGGMMAQIRATPGIVSALAEILDEEHHSTLQKMDQVTYWSTGLLVGLLFAAVGNIPWHILVFDPRQPGFVFSMTLAFAQFFTWGVVGLMLATGEHNAFTLYRVGKLVKVDLYNLDRLNPFGQSSLRNLLIIVGALAMTPLQSIDQEFRWTNYQNAILVGVPAILLLALVPIWSVHKQIRAAKARELERLEEEIRASSRSLENDSLTRLNALLERRSFVAGLRNWPMDFSLLARVVFYVLIPPLAWAGAALVELAVDSYVTG